MQRTVGLIALILLAMIATTSSAHAILVKSDPPASSALRTAPKAVRLGFNEELDPKRSSLSVWDSKNRRLGLGGIDLDDLDRKSLVVRMNPIGPGRYVVKWRAVSVDDGYVAEGALRFTILR